VEERVFMGGMYAIAYGESSNLRVVTLTPN